MKTHPKRTNSKNIFYSLTLLSISALLVSGGCNRKKPFPPPLEHTWLTMGTFASITLRGDNTDMLPQVFELTKNCFSNINSTLSTYIPASEISQINTSTNNTVAISKLTFEMLQTTLNYSRISNGAFDPTMKPLIKMWGFNGAVTPPNIPSEQTISNTLKRTGYQNLQLIQTPTTPPTYTLHPNGMTLDLGGIAKGFAVDRAYDEITNLNTNDINLLINLGGNIRCHGKATPERPWCIGVRNPFDTTEIIGTLTMTSGTAVATSGNYERFVIINNQRYAHIIDPRTGYPVQGMAEVTALCNSATEADAMSTSLYVAGIQNAPAILKKLPDCHAIMVPDKKPLEIYITPNMKKFFTPCQEYSSNVRLLRDY